MTQKLIPSLVLQDIIRNRDQQLATAMIKEAPQLCVIRITKTSANPLQLDENGALPHKFLLILIYCRAKVPVTLLLLFNDLPYFQEQQTNTAIVPDNLFIDGQFNIGLQIDDREYGSGYVSPLFSHVSIADGSL